MTAEIFCAEYNTTSQRNISNTNYELNELLKQQKALCWMLFIVAKAKVLWHRQELLATFHLLLCCFAEVIKATPTFLLLPPFGMQDFFFPPSFSIFQFLHYYFIILLYTMWKYPFLSYFYLCYVS